MSYRYEIHRDRFKQAAKMDDPVVMKVDDRRFATWMEACDAGDRWSDKWIDAWTQVFESNEEVNARWKR